MAQLPEHRARLFLPPCRVSLLLATPATSAGTCLLSPPSRLTFLATLDSFPGRIRPHARGLWFSPRVKAEAETRTVRRKRPPLRSSHPRISSWERGFFLCPPPFSCPQPCGRLLQPALEVPKESRAGLSVRGSLPGSRVTKHSGAGASPLAQLLLTVVPFTSSRQTHTHSHTQSHTQTHSHILSHAHTHMLAHLHSHTDTLIHTLTHTHTLSHTFTWSHTYTHTDAFTHTLTRIHTLTQTHTHRHTHTDTSHTHTLSHTQRHTHTDTHILSHTQRHIHTYSHSQTHPHTHAKVLSHTHSYARTLTHRHIHTLTHTLSPDIHTHRDTFTHTLTHTHRHT